MVARMRSCCDTWSNEPHTRQCDRALPPCLPQARLDPLSDETFARWVSADDGRTLEEFAEHIMPEELSDSERERWSGSLSPRWPRA